MNTTTAIKSYLSQLDIKNVKGLYHNLSYDELYEHETNPELNEIEKGITTKTGAVAVDTGIFTGRSPKDKYIVLDSKTKNTIWWKSAKNKISDNQAINDKVWDELMKISTQQLSGKKLYIQDGFSGSNVSSRMRVRVISEIAWIAHFVKNMFIRPNDVELKKFQPDFTVINACKTVNENWHKHNMNSDIYIAFNLTKNIALIGGTFYGGEIKKGIFSVMNYYLPFQNIASMHCSANMNENGNTTLFFGLSGTGKTTLSTDKNRFLIGDDEHGWDNDGVFNLEGGCYAKCYKLNPENEPEIYNAVKRDALLENVIYDDEGNIDFNDASKTENTRVSYPIHHIDNIVKPISKGNHPQKIIFLTADAFGILPPVSKLSKEQALYYFLSGYTSKIAGTERGIKEPLPTFSPCFGAPFLLLNPIVYAKVLAEKIEKHNASVYLVNTGWVGGDFVRGRRIDLQSTRNIITAIYDGSIDKCKYIELPTFGFHVPTKVKGVDSKILNPRKSWKYEVRYKKKAAELAQKFIKNFYNFTDTEEGKKLVAAGPKDIYMKQFYDYYTDKIVDSEKEHQLEIQKLKDQIFFLQEAYKNFISVNSVNSVYKNSKIYRYLPVFSYFNSSNNKDIENANNTFVELLQAIGYKLHTDYNSEKNYNNIISISKKPITKSEESKFLKTFFKYTFDSSNKHQYKYGSAINKFQKNTKEIDEIVLKLGKYIIIKRHFDTELSDWSKKELSISEQIYLDKNPHLLKNVQLLSKAINLNKI